jgi:hypothetical protein
MEKWTIKSVNSIEPHEDGIRNYYYFTAEKDATGETKDFFTSACPVEIGDAFYPTNIE